MSQTNEPQLERLKEAARKVQADGSDHAPDKFMDKLELTQKPYTDDKKGD